MPEFIVTVLSNWWVNFAIWVVSILVLFNCKLSKRRRLLFIALAIFSGLHFIL